MEYNERIIIYNAVQEFYIITSLHLSKKESHKRQLDSLFQMTRDWHLNQSGANDRHDLQYRDVIYLDTFLLIHDLENQCLCEWGMSQM